MKVYERLIEEHKQVIPKLKQQSNLLAGLRLFFIFSMLLSFYFFLDTKNDLYLLFSVASLISFVAFMFSHAKVKDRLRFKQSLTSLNQDELIYLRKEGIPFDDGKEFMDPHHAYTYDLDIFGRASLFQNLNRTTTYIGKTKLASLLLGTLENQTIKKNQEAIKEIAEQVEWRQEIQALGLLSPDNEKSFRDLVEWSKKTKPSPSSFKSFLAYTSPILLGISSLVFLYTGNDVYKDISIGLFLFNLAFTSMNLQRIKEENLDSEGAHQIIKSYSLIIERIEKKEFENQKLKEIQESLKLNGQTSSEQIKKLSSLFSKLDSLGNILGAILFNGLFLYHFQTMQAMMKWKKLHARQIENWLNAIGEVEAINSLANFYYNNQDFCFPNLNKKYNIRFENLGHPFIPKETRICNDVDFTKQKFVILTGSNMSGKSTFLRSLGVNLILAGIGAPICASEADIEPMKVLVSMRLSDSLTEKESYFFAEVKRLKQIMDTLHQQPCFVLLDEILRGTNSDDKKSGTIAIIKKLIDLNSVGVIATHDLEVCLSQKEFPDYLSNKCFEGEIIDDELSFDYKLREGVCKNKNATFLMKKMEVI